jgi:hypothetical protein
MAWVQLEPAMLLQSNIIEVAPMILKHGNSMQSLPCHNLTERNREQMMRRGKSLHSILDDYCGARGLKKRAQAVNLSIS